MPNSARRANSIGYDVEKPLRNAKIDNHRSDSISGSLRPQRSAIVPATTPPTRRITSVTVPSAPASTASTANVFWMSMRMNVRTVKSKPSNIHPRNVAANARHWSRVSSRNRLVTGGRSLVVVTRRVFYHQPRTPNHQQGKILNSHELFCVAPGDPLRALGRERSFAACLSNHPDPSHGGNGDRRRDLRRDGSATARHRW